MLRSLYLLFFSTLCLVVFSQSSFAATTVPFTVNMSEVVNVTGTPRIAVTVGGVTRYATYASGTGTSALTFNYAMVAGDVDLDGVTLTSPIDLNGGTLKDLNGNDATLTFTVPNTSGVKISYPSLSMDFTADSDGQYSLNGTTYSTLPSLLTATGGTFTRASVGTYFDSSGVMQTAASGAPRFDYNPTTLAAKGILIEEARTNYITNAQFSGAAVNVAPTGINMGPYPGITASVSGVGAINGQNYIDVTFSGTNPGPGTAYPNVSFASNVAASVGQSWNARINIINVSGTSSSAPYFELGELDTIGNYLTASTTSATTNGYKTLSRTLSSASVAKIRFILVTALASGGSINRTFRLAVPQLEQGSFPTSYIPTTTTTVTRQADIVTIPTGTWYNQSAGTFMNDVSWVSSSGTNYPMFFRVDNTTNNERWNAFYNQSGNSVGIDAYAGGIAQGSSSVASATSGTAKMASAQALNSTNFAFNGTLKTLDTAWTPPTVTRLLVDGGGINNASKWFKTLKYYPARVSDAQLQLLTQ